MDDEPHVEAEFQSETRLDGDDTARDQFTSVFFPQAQHFVVAGGQFKSITNINHAAPTVPSGFRRIPIGDLDLRHEIRLGESGIVNRFREKHSVRRMYSARIHGSKSPMTVALYQGENAEEDWREGVSRISWLRHPNLVQLYATASFSGIHAAIFHDELIPATHLLEKYRSSHFRLVYLWAFLYIEFTDAFQYVLDITSQVLDPSGCMKWIRPSTGRLCVDLTYRDYDLGIYPYPFKSQFPTTLSILEPPEVSKIADSISLNEYHHICDYQLSAFSDILLDASVHIAFIPDLVATLVRWYVHWELERQSDTMESGWTRVNSGDLENRDEITFAVLSRCKGAWWLAQANHIFDRLGTTSNRDDYFYVDRITYMLALSDIGHSIPPGYLFICPFTDLQADNSPSRFRRPECPAYWSLDSSGTERLSMAEAEQLGFPRLELEMKVWGLYWDETVYAGIRQFHEAKGYDPDSQDIARKLGYPLFKLLLDLDGFSTHMQEIENCSANSGFDEPLQDLACEESAPDLTHGPEPYCSNDEIEMVEPSRTPSLR